MADEINRKCPFCGSNLTLDTYKMSEEGKHGNMRMIVYCDACNKFCTDSSSPSMVLEEIKNL